VRIKIPYEHVKACIVRETELFECPDITPLDFVCEVGCRAKFQKERRDIRDELLAGVLDGAASIEEHEDQLRRTTRDLRTRAAKCTEVDGGFIERLF